MDLRTEEEYRYGNDTSVRRTDDSEDDFTQKQHMGKEVRQCLTESTKIYCVYKERDLLRILRGVVILMIGEDHGKVSS